MKTQMLLVRELSPLQLSAAKKMRTEELAKENEEFENATSFEVAKKRNNSCTCCGGGYSRFYANQRCGYWADDELQGDVENQENEAETLQYM